MEGINFLTLDMVQSLHEEQLAMFGGASGIIDQGVIEAVTAAPQQTMFGRFLNEDIAEMAAAYLYGFAASQGFADGNKRTAVVCADVFLEMNGYEIVCAEMEMYDAAMRAANRLIDKNGVAAWIRERIRAVPIPVEPGARVELDTERSATKTGAEDARPAPRDGPENRTGAAGADPETA